MKTFCTGADDVVFDMKVYGGSGNDSWLFQ